MRQGSLFTGIGGFDRGFEDAGFETCWQAEFDPTPRHRDGRPTPMERQWPVRVLRQHFPGIPNLGNVEEINGRRLPAVDVLTFGSPCQDLSVAGRRAGFAGARSGLFFEAARIINECRPAFAVWENVPGAFSSDGGRDFAMVLYILRELGANDVAWRVIDSQYAGVPQQRRRIYLVADFRGRRAGEILFDPESCGGHPAPSGEARSRPAFGTPDGLARVIGGVAGGQDYGAKKGTLIHADTAGALMSRARGPGGKLSGRGGEDDYNLAATLGAGGGGRNHRLPGLDADTAGRNLVTGPRDGIAYQLDARNGKGPASSADQVSLVVTHPLTAEGHDASDDGTGRGTPYVLVQDVRGGASKNQNGAGIREGETAYTLDQVSQPAVFQPRVARNGRGAPTDQAAPSKAQPGADGRGDSAQFVFDPTQVTNPTNRSRPHPGAPSHTLPANGVAPTMAVGAAIRRFTPVECERLQGFPDGWTCLCGAGPDIFSCICPDGPRYRALGNAATRTVTFWVASRIATFLEK